MPQEDPLTTTDIAEYCQVSTVAVWKWIKQNKLRAYQLPGGHYRVERGAFRQFLEENDLPIKPEFFASAKKRVLVVDDEPTAVEIVVRTLRRLGDDLDLDIATATDGFDAGLQVATFRPHLLVLDLMMPHIDGWEVCRLIRQNPVTAHVKILIITAYGIHANLDRALKAGANDFLHKPLDIRELSNKVREMLAD